MIRTKEEQENIRLLSNTQKFNVNAVVLHASNSWSHEHAKAKICYFLKKNKRNFVCEATFENGSRADIFDITWGVAYEITYKETKLSIEEPAPQSP